MIGYTCKYTPVELLEALGGQPLLLDGEEETYEQAEGLTHANLCCHAKAVLQQGCRVDELLLTDCCDSIRRVHDALEGRGSHRYLRLLDLPHQDGPCAKARLRDELVRLTGEYSAHTGVRFQREVFLSACAQAHAPPLPQGPFLAVLGARMSAPLLTFIRGRLPLPVADLTCSGNRALPPLPKDAETIPFENLMEWYAGALLSMPPCLRMADLAGRQSLTEHPGLKGIIYHTVKFCDYYGFEYAQLQKTLSLPMIKLESDFTPQPAGQLSTRLEAFVERLNLQPVQAPAVSTSPKPAGALYAGIDSGSTSTNMVVLNQEREILASAVVRTGAKSGVSADKALQDVLEKAGLKREDISWIVSTGYGRVSIAFADENVTEISCHGKGAHYFNPRIRTILDIGGQDSKAIRLSEDGEVKDFVMNDKCAAGTGRFLEMIARTLEVSLDELGAIALTSTEKIEITSMCSVFAESEVISLIANNKEKADIADGVCHAIANKASGLLRRVGMEPDFMMTGGVAKNPGVVRAVEEKIGSKLYICEEPEIVGATGAALYALEQMEA